MANNAAVSNFVSDITQDRFIPKVVDNIFNGNVLTMRLSRNRAKTWRGGTEINVPVYLTAPTTGGSYAGFDTFITTQETKTQIAVFRASQLYWNASLNGIQLALNQGEARVVDLVASELDIIGEALRQELGTQLYGDGTGNNNKDLLGLVAAVDDNTNVTTYGALSRATFTNWRATLTAQSGSLSLANLAADVDAAQVGSNMPTLAVCPPAVWTIYEALITPTVSHNATVTEFRLTPEGGKQLSNLGGNQGFRALAFRGIPVVSDEKCTAQNLYFLNEDHLTWWNIPPAPTLERTVNRGFQWTGWKEAINQDGVAGQLLFYGQLTTDSPRVHSRRTGISS